MSKQPTASAKPAPQLATPTDLGDNARADIAAVINTLLADRCRRGGGWNVRAA